MHTNLFSSWRHVFKLDPERELTDEALDAICMSGTDAVLVGGSSGVTYDNTVDLMSRIRRFEVPCALEVSSLEAAVPGFDWYFVPLVLNTPRGEWIAGNQIEAMRKMGPFIPWECTSAEGYIILNPEAEAARLTGADASLGPDAVAAHMYMADRLMRLPVVYLEYSGTFGDMALVSHASKLLTQAQLFYGGGIDDAAKARAAAEVAQTVVVGNVIYDDLEAALSTVQAVHQTPLRTAASSS
ncbi:putative glycerol-1-phosphate prenyltransferase [Paenibacillus phyllosphaerae]|uniref:Heptaprenylglyceryl phosphate synthase n=1 Tax=Paenibacillus phyllosphaerae TaxID=274593 RepID=A0A7W5B4D9_9BACL|nr:heptaprenylglyceryl phosphate synthase [Paenibacillus phyllosphaerae]MBB3114210.1 putative glycerol-1-phosphate prenyltransferase [Paenibacillus phyllosphaerae]